MGLRRRGLGPFSGGQLTAIIITLAIMVGFPVSAFAALTFSNVAITDPTGTYRALVDKNGELLVRQSGAPAGAFSVSAENSGGTFIVKLPGCSTTSCHVAITDVVLSQTNTAVTRLNVIMGLYQDASGGACTTVGAKLRDILPYEFIPAEQTTTINFTTPIVAGGNPVCLRFITGSNAGLFFSYTVNGFRQTY